MNSLPHRDQLHPHLQRNLRAAMMPHRPQATCSSNLHSRASAHLEHEGFQPSLVMQSMQMQPQHCEMRPIQQQFLYEQNIRQQQLQELQHFDMQFKLHFEQQEQQLQEQRFKEQIHQQQLQKQQLHQQQLQQYLFPESYHQLMQLSRPDQILGPAPAPQQIVQKRTSSTNNPSNLRYHHEAALQNLEKLQCQLQQSPSQPPAKHRREQSIGIPSKQTDSDCEIIAVRHRGEGVPVIQRIQGTNASPSPSHGDSGGLRSDSAINSPGASDSALNESTIHLTDSITLTVRHLPGSASGKRGHNAIASPLTPQELLETPASGESTSRLNGDQRAQPSFPPPNNAQAPSCPKQNSPGDINRALFDFPPDNPQYEAKECLAVLTPLITSRQAPRQATPTDHTPRPPTVDLIDENAHASNAYDRILTCIFCDKNFTSLERLLIHWRVIHYVNTCFRCPICNSKHPNERALGSHLKRMHNGGTTGSPPELVIPLVDLKNTGAMARLSTLGVNYVLSLNQLGMSPDNNTFCIPIMSLDANGQAKNNSISGLMSLGSSAVLPIGPVKSVPAAQQHSQKPPSQPQTVPSLSQGNVNLAPGAPMRAPPLQYAPPMGQAVLL